MSVTTYEIITDRESFRRFAPAWERLWQRSQAGVFQHPMWIASWLEIEENYQPFFAVAMAGGEPVTIMPLSVHRLYGVRLLEWAGQTYSDYCDIVGDPSMLSSLWHQIQSAGGFDVVRLKNIAPGAQVRKLVVQWQADGWEIDDDHDVCLTLGSLWENGESWFRTLNKEKKSNHNRGMRILGQSGEVKFREASHDELPLVLNRMIELKRGWLRATQQHSPLLDGDPRLLPALVDALSRMGVLSAFVLEVGDTLAAGSINLQEGRRMLAFFAAYDPKFSRASPGILLMTEYSKWAFDRGMDEIDYLRGDEGYKFEFANKVVKLATVVGSQTLVGKTARSLYKLRERKDNETEMRAVGGAYVTKHGTSRIQPGSDVTANG